MLRRTRAPRGTLVRAGKRRKRTVRAGKRNKRTWTARRSRAADRPRQARQALQAQLEAETESEPDDPRELEAELEANLGRYARLYGGGGGEAEVLGEDEDDIPIPSGLDFAAVANIDMGTTPLPDPYLTTPLHGGDPRSEVCAAVASTTTAGKAEASTATPAASRDDFVATATEATGEGDAATPGMRKPLIDATATEKKGITEKAGITGKVKKTYTDGKGCMVTERIDVHNQVEIDTATAATATTTKATTAATTKATTDSATRAMAASLVERINEICGAGSGGSSAQPSQSAGTALQAYLSNDAVARCPIWFHGEMGNDVANRLLLTPKSQGGSAGGGGNGGKAGAVSKANGSIFQVGIFLGFVRLATRAEGPHGARVRGGWGQTKSN